MDLPLTKGPRDPEGVRASGRSPEPRERGRERPLRSIVAALGVALAVSAGAAGPPPSPILFAWFGPSDAGHPEGGDLWTAAILAAEEAGRSDGVPRRLLPAWSESPWKGGVSDLARLAFSGSVEAVLGGIDGPTAHLAEQVVAKARIPQVNPAGLDRTVNLAGVPWVFSVPPDDGAAAEAIASAVEKRARAGPWLLVAATGHDARLLADLVLRRPELRGAAPALRHEIESPPGDTAGLAEALSRSGARTLVAIADAETSARIVRVSRAAIPDLAIVGGPSMARRRFLEEAGAAAEGAVLPFPCDPGFEASPFAAAFAERAGHAPDCASAIAYDAVRILVAAERAAGGDRARLAGAIRSLSPWRGVSGPVVWDAHGRNVRPVRLARIRGGAPAPF